MEGDEAGSECGHDDGAARSVVHLGIGANEVGGEGVSRQDKVNVRLSACPSKASTHVFICH